MDIRRDEPLAAYTTFRIGGAADFFVEIHDPQELEAALAWASKKGIPYLLLGGGSNVLIDDAGIRGLVIRNVMTGIELVSEQQVCALSGTPLEDLVVATIEHGLEGLVFCSGIPGSVGGAVCGNAGAFGKAVGELLLSARVLCPTGDIITASRDYFQFAYRESRLKSGGGVLIDARFRLRPGVSQELRQESEDVLALRREKHPGPEIWTAGSFFKNVKAANGEAVAAGHLLDQVGAKQLSVGDAAVYEKHANILVNRGAASSADVLCLAELLSERVKARFGVQLEREVRYVGPSGLL